MKVGIFAEEVVVYAGKKGRLLKMEIESYIPCSNWDVFYCSKKGRLLKMEIERSQ